MSAEHKSPGAAEHLLLQRSQQHCRVWHSSSSSALGSSSPPGSLRLCRTCRRRGPGWGGKSPSGKPVLFTQGPQGRNFVIKGKSHPRHLQSPSNRCVSCRDTFAVEIWFGLEMNQCEERAGSNALHKFPASRVPCRAMPAPTGSVSALLGPLSLLKSFCSTFQSEKLGGRRYETHPNVYRKGKPSHGEKQQSSAHAKAIFRNKWNPVPPS